MLLQGAGLANGVSKKRKKEAGGSVSERVAVANAEALTKALEDGTMDGDVEGVGGDRDKDDDESISVGAATDFVKGKLAQVVREIASEIGPALATYACHLRLSPTLATYACHLSSDSRSTPSNLASATNYS